MCSQTKAINSRQKIRLAMPACYSTINRYLISRRNRVRGEVGLVHDASCVPRLQRQDVLLQNRKGNNDDGLQIENAEGKKEEKVSGQFNGKDQKEVLIKTYLTDDGAEDGWRHQVGFRTPCAYKYVCINVYMCMDGECGVYLDTYVCLGCCVPHAYIFKKYSSMYDHLKCRSEPESEYATVAQQSLNLTHVQTVQFWVFWSPTTLHPTRLTSLQIWLWSHGRHKDNESQNHAHVRPQILLGGQL